MSNPNNLIVILTLTPHSESFENLRLAKAFEEVFEHSIELDRMDHSFLLAPEQKVFKVRFNTSYNDCFNQLHYDCLNLVQYTKDIAGYDFNNVAYTVVEVDENLNVIDAWSWENIRVLNYICLNRVEEEGGDLVELTFIGGVVRGTELMSECETIIRENESHFDIDANVPVIYNYADKYPGPVVVEETDPTDKPITIESINKAIDEENAKVSDPVQKSFLTRLWNTFSGRD